jgi:peroxiredoxin (alkyl hydroperoxide reductase subunit C)
MLTVGQRFPAFRLKAVVSVDPERAFEEITHPGERGKWKVFFFYPKDFTFVCPTELVGFAKLTPAFAERGARVYGGSTDSEYVHLAWRTHDPELKELPYPLLSDIRRELSGALGILDEKEGVCLRATFIVDPDGVIRFASCNDLAVGRNPAEVLRVLDALQTGELCPVDWKKGEPTLEVS